MKPLAKLQVVRTILVTGIALRSLVWGLAAALALFAAAAAIDHFIPLSVETRSIVAALAVVAGLAVMFMLGWRDRAVLSMARVALWVEEHFPSLEYALVTGVETGDESFVARVDPDRWTAQASRRAVAVLGAPFAVVAIGVIVLLLLPAGAVARVRSPHPGDALDRLSPSAAGASRLTPLVATVQPPGYSGERATEIDEPSDVRALVGSNITIRGRGDASGIVARAGTDSIAAVREGTRWAITLRVTARPTAIQLGDRTFHRVIAVEPVIDNAPTVVLATPAHDSVLRLPKGRIPLAADATDDFGIATASFEYIISSGEGETFTFRSGTLGSVKPGARRTSFSASLSLDSLALKPGDIVHLRAVARDANDVSGPGVGASETRAIRIARADEYDSVAVDAVAPSEAEKGVVSERMLIMLAEALEKKRPSLGRAVLVGESRSIAIDQKKLRRSVGEIVFTRLGGTPTGEEHSDADTPDRARTMEAMLARADSATNRSADPIDFEGDESPVVAVNKPLLEAYNAMWDASTSLELGEPAKALPFMRRALAAIQKARQAERIYLRGTPPAVVIDIDKARLKGKDKGASSLRRATAADSTTRARADRFMRIVELSVRDPHSVADSLLLLRIDALTDNAAFAAALGDAASAIRHGRGDEATKALARARRTLSGAAISRDSLTRWGIVP